MRLVIALIAGMRRLIWLAPLLLALGGAMMLRYSAAPARDLPSFPIAALVASVAVLLALLLAAGAWLWHAVTYGPPAPPSWRQQLAFGVAVLALIIGSSLFSQFDGLLHGFHQPGEVAAGVASADGFLTRPYRRAQQMREAVASWSQFARPRLPGQPADTCAAPSPVIRVPFPGNCNAPITVLAWILVVDAALIVPAYGLILGLLIVWSRSVISVERRTGLRINRERAHELLQQLAQWMIVVVLCVVLADWVENAITLGLFAAGWAAYNAPAAPTLAPLEDLSGPAVLGFFTLVKWVGLAIVASYLLLVAWLRTRPRAEGEPAVSTMMSGARALLAVRVQLLVLLVFGATLLVHEQVPDVIRRFADSSADSIVVGVLGLAATFLLVLSVWYSSSWMLEAAGPDYHLTGSRRWLWYLLGAGALLSVALALRNWLVRPDAWNWKPLAPIVVVAAAWGVTWLLNWLQTRLGFSANPEALAPAEHSGWLGRRYLPRLLASAVLIVVALALLRASAGLVLYNDLRGLQNARFVGLLVAALALVAAAGLLYWLLGREAAQDYLKRVAPPTQWRVVGLTLIGMIAGWALLVVWWTWDVGAIHLVAPWLGALGLLSANLLLLNLILSGLIAVANGRHPPNTRRGALGPPVLLLIGVWLVLVSALPPEESIHDVLPERPAGSPANPRGAETLELAFDRWRCRNGILPASVAGAACPNLASAPGTASGTRQAVPLVLIATTGGGIRAAVWTTYVLDRILGYTGAPGQPAIPRVNRVFAMSGVSGGSFGMASYTAQLASALPAQDPATEAGNQSSLDPCGQATTADATSRPGANWICARLGRDYLAPAMGWLLYVENPWSLLRFDLSRDRGRVMEESWERAGPLAAGGATSAMASDLFALSAVEDRGQAHAPVLVFNGTSVESACRVNTSILKLNGRDRGDPATRCLSTTSRDLVEADRTPSTPQGVLGATVDLIDLLCADEVLPLSKAALLSGRFPVISPSGHVRQCAPSPTASDPPETYVVDGGYLENSGAATALEIWNGLAPLVAEHNQDTSVPAIVPFFIQIDNGYDEPAAPGGIPSQPELIVPFATYGATMSAHQALAHQVAENSFNQPFRVGAAVICGRYAQFTLRAHPGPQAPLGWSLSRESFLDLVDQFVNTPAGQASRQQVERWFGQLDLTRTACAPS